MIKEKGRIYEELFPVNKSQTDLEQVKKLLKCFESTKKTNMDIFIKKCLESLHMLSLTQNLSRLRKFSFGQYNP